MRFFNLRREDEWVLQPSLARANRHAPVGIVNMHAAVKGCPVTGVSDANAISKAIVQMQAHMKTKKLQEKLFKLDEASQFPSG